MKYRTLAVLAFAGVLAVSGAAFARADDPNDPFPKRSLNDISEAREKILEKIQNQNQKNPPVFSPGKRPETSRPSRPQQGTKPDRRPPEHRDVHPDRRPPEHKDVHPDRRPPEHKDVHPDRRPPEHKDVHPDRRPPEPPKDGHRRKLPPEDRKQH